MSSKTPAAVRLIWAQGNIRRLTADIKYHDAEASSLRKEREREKGKLKRAQEALMRGKP